MAEEPEIRFRFDYNDPENVESKVPGEQKLRESVEASELAIALSALNEEYKIENPGDYILTPVVSVTKNEEIRNGIFVTLKSPVYPEIQSEVLHDPLAIRRMGDHSEDRRRTRIPKLRFRQAANRVKEERRASYEAENGESVPSHQRRSSIPRLKKYASVENPTSEKTPTLQKFASVENDESTPFEDEFDKIYDEVVSDSVSIDENILNTKIDDPVKVENSFEEIIHAYDENKVQPVSNEKAKQSRIPMLKRRSEHEIEVPKNVKKASERISAPGRLKIQDILDRYSNIQDEEFKSEVRKPVRTGFSEISDENNTFDEKSNVEELLTEITQNVQVVEVSNQPIQSSDIISDNVSDEIEVIEEKAPISSETVEMLPTKEIVHEVEVKNISKESVKIATIEEINIITQNLLNNTEYTIQYDEQETSNAPTSSFIENTAYNNDQWKDDVKEEITIKDFNLDSDRNSSKIADNNKEPLLKGKVSHIIRQLSSNAEHKEETRLAHDDEIPKPKSVLSKIAMFERSTPQKVPRLRETNIKNESKLNDDIHSPKIVNGTLKIRKENNLNGGENKNEGKITFGSRSIEDNNNVVQNVTSKEVDVSSLRIIDTVPRVEEIITKDLSAQNLVLSKEVINENESNDKVETTTEPQEIEIEAIKPFRIEYAQPINYIEREPFDFKPKINQIRILNNNEDVAFINYKNETPDKIEPKTYDTRAYKSLSELNQDKPERRVHEYKIKNIENESIIHDYKVENSSEDIKSDFRRPNKISEDYSYKKSKSIDIDLGNAVKGKVHNLIDRMNSTDMLFVEKREVISAKERPRKRSVSEKIALFEGKLSIASTPARQTTSKPQQPSSPPELNDDELKAKVAELVAAKETYGEMRGGKRLVLANGVEMPEIALGTALLDPKLTFHVVSAAIDLGYRAIDTAFIYGNEKEVGEAIKKKIEDGTVKRDDLFIISKLWSTFHRTDLVIPACQRSLDAMGLEYFDLYLVHNPMSFKEGPDPFPKIANVLQYSEHEYLDAWFGMEQLVPLGMARAVGGSNFNARQLQRLLDKARVRPVVNQVECHPYLTQHKLDEFCADRNIKLSCFGVLGSRGTPAAYKGTDNAVLDDPLVQVMAAGLGITPAQLLIRYQLEQGRGVVVKASSAAHLHENLMALNCTLSPAQVDALSALNRNKRTFTFKGMGDTHKNYPFKAQF